MTGFLMPPGISAKRAVSLSRMGIMRTQLPLSHKGADLAAGYTLHTTWALDNEFDLIRVVWQNFKTSPFTIDAATIAPSAQIGTGFAPVDSAGAAVSMTSLTFNAAGALTDYPQASGAASSVTLPASADGYFPTVVASDWAQVSSLTRTDSADGRPLVMVRAYSAAGGNWAQGMTNDINGTPWETENRGRLIRTYIKGTGNFTGTGAFVAPMVGPSPYIGCTGIQTYSRAAGASIMALGDSLQQGHITDGGQFYAPGHYATALLTRVGRPVSFINSSRSGGSTLQFHTHGRAQFDLFKPDIVVIEVWTPNDTPRTLANGQLGFARAMAFAEYALRAGAKVILSTAVPFGLVTAEDNVRKAINDLARKSGLPVADYDAAVTDGATPARTLAPYASGNHLSTAGYARCGEVALAPVIDRLLA